MFRFVSVLRHLALLVLLWQIAFIPTIHFLMNTGNNYQSVVTGISNNQKPRIAIISASTPIGAINNKGETFSWDVYGAIYPLSVSNWNHYARKHGYSLYFMNGDLYNKSRAAYWVKMSLLKYYLNIGFDYVFYTDLDWLFVDLDATIEDIIASQPNKHIYLGSECFMSGNRTKLLSGTFIIKNSKISLSFLNEWESLHNVYHPWSAPEQTALEHMMSSKDINSSIGQTSQNISNILFQIKTKYKVSNTAINAAQGKIQNWKHWKQYVAILNPHRFMTYDYCIRSSMDEDGISYEYGCNNIIIKQNEYVTCNDNGSNGKIYGIHFPSNLKSKRMKKFYYPIKLKYDISLDSVQFKKIKNSDMMYTNEKQKHSKKKRGLFW